MGPTENTLRVCVSILIDSDPAREIRIDCEFEHDVDLPVELPQIIFEALSLSAGQMELVDGTPTAVIN